MVYRRGLLTREQLIGLRTLTPARVVQKMANGAQALVEWVEWEFTEEKEEQVEPARTA